MKVKPKTVDVKAIPRGTGPTVAVIPKLFAYTFELNQADQAVPDQTGEEWTQSIDQFDKHQLKFTYTLKNKIVGKPGRIVGKINSTSLTVPPSFTNVVTAIPPNQNFKSEFISNTLPAGKYTIQLDYITQGWGFNPKTGRGQTFDSVAASAQFDYTVNIAIQDVDKDGIDDRVEHTILEKFRPYYKYSSGESHNPTDCITYVKLCSGYSDPSKILFPATNIVSTKGGGGSCIGPDVQQKALANTAYAGAPWDQEMIARNIGLYGHVVPIKLVSPDNYDLNHIPSSSDVGKTYYKVEYWQFFGYNIGCVSPSLDHQGDWTVVQLIINPDNMLPVVVMHYAHGSIESRFCLDKSTTNDMESTKEGELVKVYKGSNYNTSMIIDAINGITIPGTSVSDNELLFYKDPNTNEWSHPVVYVEKGSHELYPTKAWNILTCPDHNGNGYSFLANTPPNLGEVENPLNETPFANIILQFNGKWGCTSGSNDSPPGPCLHSEWTYPASSSIRWLLKSLGK